MHSLTDEPDMSMHREGPSPPGTTDSDHSPVDTVRLSHHRTRQAVFALIVILFTLSAACVTPPPGPGEITPTPAPPAGTTPPATTLTPQVPAGLPVPSPMETPLAMNAYVARPFGYVEYAYHPEDVVRVMEIADETLPDGSKVITGRARNEGTRRLGLVIITFTLHDARGDVTGNAHARVEFLEPGATWRFRTEPFESQSFQFSRVADIFHD